MPNKSAEAYFESGEAKEKAGAYRQALQEFTKAIELDPQNAHYYVARGRVLSNQSQSQMGNRAAYTDFDMALALDPCCAAAYFQRGQLKQYDLYTKDIEGAISDFTDAIHCDRDFVEAYEGRALIYMLHKGDFAAAIADYTEAIWLKPLSDHNYLNRGRAKYKLGDVVNGLKDIVASLRLGTELSPTLLFGKSERVVLGELDFVIQANPDPLEAYILRGMSLGFLNEHRLAIRDFDKVIELSPDDWLVYLFRAHTYSRLDDTEQTLIDLNRSIELNPQQAKAYLSRGMVFNRMGELEKAIHDFEFLIEHYPNHIDVHDFKLAKVVAKLKKAL